MIGVDFVHAPCRFAFVLWYLQRVLHVDPSKYEYRSVLFDFSSDLAHQVVGAHGNLARSQRAGKSARESATGGRNDVIDRRRMRFHPGHVDAVMLGDRAVDTKQDRLAFGRKGRGAEGTTEPANLHFGFVDDVRHFGLRN